MIVQESNIRPKDYEGPKTPMTSMEKWVMCELIDTVAKVHEMSEKGDFRPISRLLVGFALDVLLRRQWGYRDIVGHYLSQDELTDADFSSIYRFCSVFDQYISLLHIGNFSSFIE